MQKKYSGLLVVGGILVILLIWITSSYNSLVNKQEKVNQQWAEVQSTYQRRVDLIPNLVNVVKGVADFEKGTLEKIAEARAKAAKGLTVTELSGANYEQQQQLQNELAGSVNRLIIQIERYPNLKGTDAYSGLQTQLEGTERRILVARKDFNEAVNNYNLKVRSFPSNIVAGLFGFARKKGFEADAGTEKTVQIKFN